MQIIHKMIAVLEVPEPAALVQQWVRTRWTPAEAGWIKINVDGAISLIQGVAGTGFVARNGHGSVIRTEGVKSISPLRIDPCSSARGHVL